MPYYRYFDISIGVLDLLTLCMNLMLPNKKAFDITERRFGLSPLRYPFLTDEIPKTSQTVVLDNININPIHRYIACKTFAILRTKGNRIGMTRLQNICVYAISHQPLQLD